MKWLVVCVSLVVTGCTLTPDVPVDQTLAQSAWLDRQPSLEQITQWRIDGRIAILQGEDFYAVSLHWRQKQADFDIDLSGPMGSGHFKLKGQQNGRVSLRDSEQNQYTANNPEALIYQHTGMQIPVNGMFYWVRGLPDPSMPQHDSIIFDALGHIQTLTQDGWTVEFSEYANFAAHQLPEKLVMRNNDVEIKLIVHRWKLKS